MNNFELVEIDNIEYNLDHEGVVYDLTVEDDHSYNIEGIIVHNSVCTTRLKAGVGYPQLSAVIECADAAHGLKGHVISDGGIVYPADIGKAFGGGADFVMLGGMFAGHDEGGGEIIESNNQKFIQFYGMSSHEAMNKHYGQKTSYRTSEGRLVKIPYKGPVDNTVEDILGSLRSTCTYVGATLLKDLSKCTTFIRVNNTHNRIFEGNTIK